LFGGGGGCGSGWYAGGGAVIMNRNNEDVKTLNFAAAAPFTPVLTNRSAEMDYTGGVEAYIGKCLGCGWAIEARYWGLEDDSEANTFGVYNPVNGLLQLDYTDGVGPQTVYDWYASGTNHRLRRDYEFDNLELNFIKTQCSVCKPKSFNWPRRKTLALYTMERQTNCSGTSTSTTTCTASNWVVTANTAETA